MGNVVTEGDSSSQNKLAFQRKSSLNEVCIIAWEFRVMFSMLFIWAHLVFCG